MTVGTCLKLLSTMNQSPALCDGRRSSSDFLDDRSHCCFQIFEDVFSYCGANLRQGALSRLILTYGQSHGIDIHSFDLHINKENACRSHPS